VWQSPRIKSVYTPRASVTALFRQYMQYGFWKVAVIRKHRALAAWRHAVPPLFVGSIAGAVLLTAIAALLGMHTAAAWIGAALAAELLVYGSACCVAALGFSRSLELPSLAMLPFVMGMYHVAYGCGFLAGLVRRERPHTGDGAPVSAFTELTR
jgi:hypothetical protein